MSRAPSFVPFAATPVARPCALVALLAAAIMLGGCTASSARSWWPFGARAVAPLPVADEIIFESPAEGLAPVTLPQYWKRNTLLVDLQGVSGNGAVRMRAKADEGWPFRIAVRVRPGAIERLEVQADQRVIVPIDPAGGEPRDIELAPGVHSPRTSVIELRWGTTAAALAPSQGTIMRSPALQESPPGR